jgi:hypothetical protein
MYGRQIEHAAGMNEAFRREVTFPAAARQAAHEQALGERQSARIAAPSPRRLGGFRIALLPALLRLS